MLTPQKILPTAPTTGRSTAKSEMKEIHATTRSPRGRGGLVPDQKTIRAKRMSNTVQGTHHRPHSLKIQFRTICRELWIFTVFSVTPSSPLPSAVPGSAGPRQDVPPRRQTSRGR